VPAFFGGGLRAPGECLELPCPKRQRSRPWSAAFAGTSMIGSAINERLQRKLDYDITG
jgi:hypothetical protein